jgi:hypothetical protein
MSLFSGWKNGSLTLTNSFVWRAEVGKVSAGVVCYPHNSDAKIVSRLSWPAVIVLFSHTTMRLYIESK